MSGILYAVGVGPGDPELLTLKAVKIMEKAEVIACPSKNNKPGVAYAIAAQACPFLTSKEILSLNFPMNKENLSDAHKSAAETIIAELATGKDVAFLTLGDPCLYSTFSYISETVKKAGFETQVINGIPSFCAAAAKTGLSIAEGDDSVLITAGEYKPFDGTLIIMKAGSKLKELKSHIQDCEKTAYLIENCGMQDEKIYSGLDEIPDKSGYFSILIVK